MEQALLSTAYLAPVQYYTKFILHPGLQIEACENYSKQTYRNRCIIAAANGVQVLSIPVGKEARIKVPIHEVRVDYDTDWRRNHVRSIASAYRNSPFFQYYWDDILPVYDLKYESLLELNSTFHNLLLRLLGIGISWTFTSAYHAPNGNPGDFRDSIHPKASKIKPDPHFSPAAYNQVFMERYGFIPNLSMLDLLFNEGPNALQVLKKSCRH